LSEALRTFALLNQLNMKYLLFIMIVSLTAVTGVEAKIGHAPKALIALSKKLNSLRSISFNYTRESNYPDTDYYNKFTGSCYIDFNQNDEQTVSRFRMECDKFIQVYNGTEEFFLNKIEKTYRIRIQPKQRSFSTHIFFMNSIPTLRSVIQRWVQNDSIAMHERDTVIENKTYKMVQVDMRDFPLMYINDFEKLKRIPDSITLYYNIIIDPVTGLPYQIVHSNNQNRSINKTIFTEIDIKPNAPATDSWFYTTYQKAYTPEKKEKSTPLIAAGVIMPGWSLPEYNGKDEAVFESSDCKGKLVLVDFWIKNCGHCMKSFPELQRLQKTYGGNGFQLVSINAWDKKEQIDFFYKREKPLYKMLYNGEALAKTWGVDGYPTVVLIDKTGRVIYSGGFDYAKVEELIKANL
jgi:thiol-disulfide isomerase/thioredoxin